METDHIIHQTDIVRVKGCSRTQMQDYIIDEDILEIFINDEKIFELVFSMSKTADLAVGILFTQGIVQTKNEIKEINVLNEGHQCRISLNKTAYKRFSEFRKNRQIRGSSGGLLLTDMAVEKPENNINDFTITPEQVLTLIQKHGEYSELFKKTGAVHSAGLCSPDKILSYYEDIGRHNAVDKLVGNILLNQTSTADKVVTVSCRISLEIIGKIIRTGIPIVISNAAPTLGAVRLAEKAGLTIVGFARSRRFNIYSHDNRIV